MIAALIIFGVAIAAALLYGAVRLGDRPSRAEARQFEASLDDWQWHAAPTIDHEWPTAPASDLVPGAGFSKPLFPVTTAACPAAPDTTVKADSPAPEDPPAGDEDPGPGGLPEGDTQLLWPPQETAGPGDPLTPLEKARAAMDEVKATPLSDYLDEVGEATAYGDAGSLWNWVSDETNARGFAAIKEAL